jgi:Ca2+-binding RTX toxin-like protein
MADQPFLELQTYTPNSDIAAGFQQNQIIFARAGNDTLLGLQPNTANPGQTQIDFLIGDLAIDDPAFRQWSDTFVLGDWQKPYYANGNPQIFGLNDFALTVDFNPAQDKVQLYGTANDYQLVDVGIGEALVLQSQTGPDVIGFFLGNSNLNLEGNYFQYKGNTPPPGPVLPQALQLGSSGFDLTPRTATDPSGNIYIAGGTTGSLGGPNNGDSRDALVTKYDSQGNLLFTKQFGTSNFDSIFSIATDNQGSFYVTGTTEGNLATPLQASGADAFIAKYDSNGNQQWIQQFGRELINDGLSIDVDNNGNAYVSGITVRSSPDIATDDFWVTKYDTNGNRQWFTEFGSSSFDEPYANAVSNDGSVYAAGWTLGNFAGTNAGLYDAALAKLDNNGQVEWTRQFGTPDYEWIWGVDTDSQGNVYATGWTLGSLAADNAGSYDAFLAKYDSQGNQQWIKQFGSAGDDETFGINIDSQDNIFLTGYTNGDLAGPNAGSYDAWAARYDTNGNQVWIQQYGTPQLDNGLGITSDNAGNVYATGITDGSFGGINAGSFDSWLAKLNPATGTLLDFSSTPQAVNTSPVLETLASDISTPEPVNASPVLETLASNAIAPQPSNQEMVGFIGTFFQEFVRDNNVQLYAGAGSDSNNTLPFPVYGNQPTGCEPKPIYGDCGDNTLSGGNDNDILDGKGGNDTLYGGEGNNKLYGDDGNDTLYAGAGNDILDGGEGNNLIYAGKGQNIVTAGSGNDEIYTRTGNDIINAGGGNNLIHAGMGKNTIFTGAGNDTIYARTGNDFIYAGAGDDLIYAGKGDNIIYGGTGNNTIYSGNGHDQFVLTAGEGASTISNFKSGKDLLVLTDGLTFEQLSITQGNHGNEFFTQVSVANSNDLLATLNWVQADTITSSSFTLV